MTRLTILTRLVANGEPAQLAVMKLIDLISLLASMLSAEARVAIAAQLRDEANALAPPSERRALH